MITASFRHIGGIGPLRERQLWLSGVRSWAEVPAEGDILSPRLDEKLRAGVAASVRRLAERDLEFFGRALPQTEHWRLLPQVIEEAAFLDIEAAGDKVTVAGVLDADGLASFRGDLSRFLERSRRWRALVTFNGTIFDVPILRRALPGWEPPAVHVDLRHVYQRLRDKGGLKQLEVRVGFFRPPHLPSVAPTRWRSGMRRGRVTRPRCAGWSSTIFTTSSISGRWRSSATTASCSARACQRGRCP